MASTREKAITLIALVITIVILIILAGVTINTLGGENGLISKVKQAKIEQMKAEAKENISLAIMQIQINEAEQGKKTTLQSLHDKLPSTDTRIGVDDYTPGETILGGIYDAGKKQFKYTIDEFFNVTIGDEVIKKTETVIFGDLIWSSGTATVEISTKTPDIIEYQVNGTEDGKWITGSTGTTTVTGLNQDDVLYARLTDGTNTTEPEKIEIKDIIQPEEFSVTVTDIGLTSLKVTGSTIDNQTGLANYTYVALKTTGDKIEYPNITETSYEITGLEPETEYTVYMLAYDNAGNARKSNEEKITTKKLEITTTEPIIGTTTTATSSVADNSQTRGTTLYIKFTATLEGTACTISPAVPYSIKANGKYNFTVTGIYGGKTVTKDIEVVVNKYKAAAGLVKYDAGDWTKEEIEALQSRKLYDLNASKTTNSTFKLNSDSGLNFTFGGFTYKGDTANESYINSGKVITSRNKSVSPGSGDGTPKYDGWRILTKETKADESGNTIKNEDGTERIYITKLIHAGSPENYVFDKNITDTKNLAYRSEYLLSNGERKTEYSTLSSGTTINPRSWDMYKDKDLDSKGYIKEVHALTWNEMLEINGGNSAGNSDILNIDSAYWCANAGSDANMSGTAGGNSFGQGKTTHCWGIRPVVTLNSGVYIASGNGTEADPYILAKE